MKIQGAFPVRWAPEPGRDGTGVFIRTSTTKYAASTSGTVTPTSGWQNSVPEVSNGNYLWTWVHVEYSDGTQTDLYSVSRMGIDGRGIQSSVVTYSQQATPVDPETITNWGSFPSTLTDGYWLYTKTHIVYSDGNPTDSYSVSQIGVGSYYAGCEEYYCASSSPTVPPSGYAQPGTYPSWDGSATTWGQSRPTLTANAPYLWNFEVSHDSRGNSYVTSPICIGNFAKGITSIVETYTISAHDNKDDMLAATTERVDYPWADETHAVVPNDVEPYKWKKTVTTYNDNTTQTDYHICAIKGMDGKGAVYIDLDNENDSMLYDGAGNLVSGSVSSRVYLYENGQKKTSNLPSFSIIERSSSITAPNASVSYDSTNQCYVLTISGMTGDSGWVIVGCTYNGVPYRARMTVKRLVGVDKYELELNKNAVTYNQTRGILSDASILVKVWRTPQNGTREQVTNMSGLTVKVLPNGSHTGEQTITFAQGVGTITLTASDVANRTNYLVTLEKSGVSGYLDYDSIPVCKVQDGPQGHAAIILDLDNENDSILYDGAGNKVSADVTSQAILLDGGEDKTSDVTSWSLTNKTNVTGSINSSGLITITAVSATSGSAIAKAVYGGKEYTAKITIKKLIGVDKYEIVCTPNALTYNTTKQTNQVQNVNVKVYRTAQNGTRSLVSSLSAFGLNLWQYYIDSGGEHSPTEIQDGSGAGQYHSGADTNVVATNNSYRYELHKDGVLLDSETVPIGKTSDGDGAFILDLDNENDSMLYDGADNLISGQVVSTASLFKGATKITSGITWKIDSVVGCTKANGGNATNTEQTGATDAWISTNGLVKVNGISTTNASVVVKATYGGKSYTATLTLKKLKGVDKYELVINPSALTYNQTTQKINDASSVTVAVEVWRTAQNGTRTRISDYNQSGGGAHHLEISVKRGDFDISTTSKSYGVDFDVNGNLADNSSAINVVLKKDNIVQDSETIPIAKTANGSGLPGPGAKAIYKLSFEKPATPTGASPSGWSNDIPTQDDVKVTPQGDWVKDDDGYLRAPSIGTYQTNIETLSFVTTASNQKIYLRVKATVGAGSFVEIGKVDRGSISTSDDYIRHVSGSNQDTGDIEVTVSDAGTHFIIVKYYRAGNADTYAKVICGMMSLWQSNAKTYDGDNVATWSEPFRANATSSDDEPMQVRGNLLKQTPFVSGIMSEWDIKNGLTTVGIQGRNAFKGDPAYDEATKNLLQQKVYNPDGVKQLQPNSWYTLSFWAKAEAYKEFTINQTSKAYRFGLKKVHFEAGVESTLMVSGSISQAAKNAGKVLRIYIWGPTNSWSWNRAITIDSTSVTWQSITFEVPETGWYYISSYVYLLPSGGNSAVDGHTAFVDYYRVTRGMRLITRLYHTTGGDSSSAIDTEAGRKVDGEHEYDAPADNAAEFKLSEAWSRHTLTFKTKSTLQAVVQELLFELNEGSHTTYICMPKLEQGTSATDYVANETDTAEMAVEELGFPYYRGQYVDDPSQTEEGLYQWNETRRDYVAYPISGEWKRFFVKRKGQTVPINTPPQAGGNTYWEEESKIRTLSVNTFIGNNCDIGGFLVSGEKMISSHKEQDGTPTTSLDGQTGKFVSNDVDLRGKVTATSGKIGDFDLVNGDLHVGDSDDWNRSSAYGNITLMSKGLMRLLNTIIGTVKKAKISFGFGSFDGQNADRRALTVYRSLDDEGAYNYPVVDIIQANSPSWGADGLRVRGGLSIFESGIASRCKYISENAGVGLNLQNGSTFVIKMNAPTSQNIQLPSSNQIRNKFLLDSSTPFAMRLTLISDISNQRDMYIIFNQTYDSSCYFYDSDGSRIGSALTLHKGNTIELMMVYNGTELYAQRMYQSD